MFRQLGIETVSLLSLAAEVFRKTLEAGDSMRIAPP
jgi:hypothetical protein